MSNITELIQAVFLEGRQRGTIKLFIKRMEREPRTLDDIGFTLKGFAAAQWEGHSRHGALRLYRARRSGALDAHGRRQVFARRDFHHVAP